MSLEKVLKKIYEKYEAKKAIDHKSSGSELKAFMLEILPDYDQDRVYTSDIKKIVMWYNLLVEKDLLDFNEDEKEEDTAEEGNEETSEATEPDTEEIVETDEEETGEADSKEEEENKADKA
ncbi:MAG: hypothetical protein B6I19_04370 [Bacteroidetes bacterium 4572_114]|nr:MAG: hypothetical protein B6I19_04370 [Bacteroidetes bacterium 4572_114]